MPYQLAQAAALLIRSTVVNVQPGHFYLPYSQTDYLKKMSSVCWPNLQPGGTRHWYFYYVFLLKSFLYQKNVLYETAFVLLANQYPVTQQI